MADIKPQKHSAKCFFGYQENLKKTKGSIKSPILNKKSQILALNSI